MLTQICQYLRNWFEREILTGDFTIAGGVLTYSDGTALSLLSGQYYRIIGSVLNDGVHRYDPPEGDESPEAAPLADETFTGAVWSMAVPSDLLTLDADIKAWISANAEAINSPYQSESFGGYSYSLKSGGSAHGGSGDVTWQSQYAAALAPWRKI